MCGHAIILPSLAIRFEAYFSTDGYSLVRDLELLSQESVLVYCVADERAQNRCFCHAVNNFWYLLKT